MRQNINRARKTLERIDEIEQIQIDGDMSEAIIRAMVDADDAIDRVEQEIEDLPIEISHTKYVGFGTEVTIK